MIENEQDLINQINRKKENIPIFNGNPLQNIHDKVVDSLKSHNHAKSQTTNSSNYDNKVKQVIAADKKLRAAVQEFSLSLFDLNDNESARKLIAEHIFMLNNIFKEFE